MDNLGVCRKQDLNILLTIVALMYVRNFQLPKSIFPSGYFPTLQFTKRQLPKSIFPSGNLPTVQLPSGNFPSGNLPTVQLPSGNFPSGNLPTVQFTKRQLPKYICSSNSARPLACSSYSTRPPKPIIAAALGPTLHLAAPKRA